MIARLATWKPLRAEGGNDRRLMRLCSAQATQAAASRDRLGGRLGSENYRLAIKSAEALQSEKPDVA